MPEQAVLPTEGAHNERTSRRNLRAALLAAMAIALCWLGQAPVEAQTVIPFAGLSKNSDQPIDIELDVLLVHDSQKNATFKGNVKAVQGHHAPLHGA